MRKRLAARIVTALAVLAVLIGSTQWKPTVFAARPQASSAMAADKANSSRGTGDDPNIKGDKQQAVKNDPANEPPAPPKKGGAKTRGFFDCWVTANNYTPWWVDVYVDGTYRGQVAPWGAGTVNAGAGGTTLYGSWASIPYHVADANKGSGKSVPFRLTQQAGAISNG